MNAITATATQEAAPVLKKISGTVVEITPAPAPNRSGKIKLDNGVLLYAFPDKIKLAHEGYPYEFAFTERNKDGVIFRDVKTVRNLEAIRDNLNFVGTPEVAAQRGQRAQAAQAPRDAAVHQEPRQAAPSNGNGNGNANWYRPTHPRDAERMFVCATLGHFIDRGAVKAEVAELVDTVNVLREVWTTTFGQDDHS